MHTNSAAHIYITWKFFEFSGDNSMTKQASRKSGKWQAESERKIEKNCSNKLEHKVALKRPESENYLLLQLSIVFIILRQRCNLFFCDNVWLVAGLLYDTIGHVKRESEVIDQM